jgi:phosphoadenosine phosphosulfate reductase
MNEAQIQTWNRELRGQSPLEITRWAIAQAAGRAIVSTNFRPYEAVMLHLATTAQPDIPVLWVDHGFNRPATYRHAETLRVRLGLNLLSYLPRMSAAHYLALNAAPPAPEDEAALREFSNTFKLEPFERAMKELAPTVWLTALRRSQNPQRAELDIVTLDPRWGALKVSPVFYQEDQALEAYLQAHQLPNEWDYYDPAKAEEKRECGLHVKWK